MNQCNGINSRSVAFIISEFNLQITEQPVHQLTLLWVSFKASISRIVISMIMIIQYHIYILINWYLCYVDTRSFIVLSAFLSFLVVMLSHIF